MTSDDPSNGFCWSLIAYRLRYYFGEDKARGRPGWTTDVHILRERCSRHFTKHYHQRPPSASAPKMAGEPSGWRCTSWAEVERRARSINIVAQHASGADDGDADANGDGGSGKNGGEGGGDGEGDGDGDDGDDEGGGKGGDGGEGDDSDDSDGGRNDGGGGGISRGNDNGNDGGNGGGGSRGGGSSGGVHGTSARAAAPTTAKQPRGRQVRRNQQRDLCTPCTRPRTLELYCGRAGWSAHQRSMGNAAWFLDWDAEYANYLGLTSDDIP
jgi:hypothetical protein